MAKIFVNYRRDDVPGDARGVRGGLAAKFGKANVFMDVDNLLAGQRFDIELAKALDACDVLIAIIGPRWMEQLKRRFLVQPSGELARGRPRREHRILPVDDLRRPCREDAAVNR